MKPKNDILRQAKPTVSLCIFCPKAFPSFKNPENTWPTKDPDSLISEVDETGAEKLLGSQEMEVEIFWMIKTYTVFIYSLYVCIFIVSKYI